MNEIKQSINKKDSSTVQAVERTRSGKVFVPAVDIIESEKSLTLLADMPGVDKGSIDLTLENNVLTIQGDVNWEPPAEMELLYKEYEVGDFKRAFTLDDSIQGNKIEAKYENGVLSLTLPKAEPAKPKKIAIN